MILDGITGATITSTTSSFPYHAEGPIDFANSNFIITCQTDKYYDASTTNLVSEVTQCNNPQAAYWTVLSTTAIFAALVVAAAWIFARKYTYR